MYWRMQLHPSDAGRAVEYTFKGLAAGYVGLDFASEVGDLLDIPQDALPVKQRDYWAFAHEMSEGDRVLIIAHHFPVALARISGSYNYIRETVPELGIWFRHFRKVDQILYRADHVTDVRRWVQLRMTNTISSLSPTTQSYQLIESWLADVTASPVT